MAERAPNNNANVSDDDTYLTLPSSNSRTQKDKTLEVYNQGVTESLDVGVQLGAASMEAYTTEFLPDNDEDGRNIMSIGAVRFGGYLTLTEQSTGIKIKIDSDDLENATVGRLNRRTGERPTIDLTDFIKPHDGVSRHHASLFMRGELLMISDHGSLNGTFLNEQRMIAGQPRILRDKDTLRIGRITLRVSFDNLTTENANT